MQAQQEDDAEDDGREENLSDVVVEDLLIRIRGLLNVGILLPGYFAADDGIHRSGCVLIDVHWS